MRIEHDIKLDYQDVTAFNNRPTKPENLEVTSERIQLQNSSTNRVRFSWSRGLNGSNVKFTVHFDRGGGFKTRKNMMIKKIKPDWPFKPSAFAVSNEFLVPFTLADVPTPLP